MYMIFASMAASVAKVVLFIIKESLAAMLQLVTGGIGIAAIVFIIGLTCVLNKSCGDLYTVSLVYVILFYVAIGLVCCFCVCAVGLAAAGKK